MRDLIATLEQAAAHERLTFLCSFQKEESVILDALVNLAGGRPVARVVTIDTGVLFPETLTTWRAFEERFGVRVEVEDAADPDRPYTGPAEHCCSLGEPSPKVAALERALAGSDAWVTGIRREQGPSRAPTEHVEWDAKRSMWKYNPLAAWTEQDLWLRIHDRDLPYHPLHDAGYASIGCATCTLAGAGREGRWAGTDKTECGLHVAESAAGG